MMHLFKSPESAGPLCENTVQNNITKTTLKTIFMSLITNSEA